MDLIIKLQFQNLVDSYTIEYIEDHLISLYRRDHQSSNKTNTEIKDISSWYTRKHLYCEPENLLRLSRHISFYKKLGLDFLSEPGTLFFIVRDKADYYLHVNTSDKEPTSSDLIHNAKWESNIVKLKDGYKPSNHFVFEKDSDLYCKVTTDLNSFLLEELVNFVVHRIPRRKIISIPMDHPITKFV